MEIIKNGFGNQTMSALSHGDLCLPNIMVAQEGKWYLIDWGKGGLGDQYRDLYSLQLSLTKNIDYNIFSELCLTMNIQNTLVFQKKTELYKLIDIFGTMLRI